MSTKTVETPYIQGKDVSPETAKKVWSQIVDAGRECFENTNVVQGGKIGETEIQATHRFFQRVGVANPEIFNPGLQEHLHLTARIQRVIGETLNSKGEHHNLHELELLGYLHDLGRTFSHRKGRNEKVADVLMRRIGISEALIDQLPPDKIFNPQHSDTYTDEEINRTLGDLGRVIDPQEMRGFVLLADILAKHDPDTGKLRRWDTVTTTAHPSADQNYDHKYEWPSEKDRMKETLRTGHRQAVNTLYTKLGNWAEGRLGISLDTLVERVENSLDNEPLYFVNKE